MLRNLSICPLNLPQFIPLDFVLMENLGLIPHGRDIGFAGWNGDQWGQDQWGQTRLIYKHLIIP